MMMMLVLLMSMLVGFVRYFVSKNECYDDDDNALQECGDLLSGCYGEEETTAQKDHQVFLSEN